MTRTPWWVMLSAGAAPVFLIGGWTVAAARQPAGYDSIRDTISALAGHAATDRWVMTFGLAGLGACHMVTALGVRSAARAGRVILAVGGLATLAVSVLPLPRVGSSTWHGLAALIGFVALAVWAAFAPSGAPVWALGRAVSITATIVLLLIVGWFGISLSAHSLVGLSERFAAGAEALWPLCVVIATARAEVRFGARPQVDMSTIST